MKNRLTDRQIDGRTGYSIWRSKHAVAH